MQHHQPSHEVNSLHSQPQPEHPPVQQYTYPLSRTNARAQAPHPMDHTHLTPKPTNQSQIQLPSSAILLYPYQDSGLTCVDPSQYHTGHITQLPPSRTPVPLPVPPSQLYQDSSTSHMHQAVHPLPTQQPLNPASPHVASDTGQPQVAQGIPMHGYHNQSPSSPSIARTQAIPVHLSQPLQGRSAHRYSHDVQSGLAPSYSAHVYPSTAQHPTLPNTQCYPQLLPVPPSQFYRHSATSQVAHPLPTQQPLNPASPHVASDTGQPQVAQGIPMHGYRNQSPSSPSIARTQAIPVHLSQPLQGRSAHHYSHDVQPLQSGLAPSYSAHVYPSTAQHPTLPNTQCYPQLLPVPPSQFHQESSTSNVRPAVHLQSTHRPLNPASPQAARYTGQPQMQVQTGSMDGYHSQPPFPSLPPSLQEQLVPVHSSQLHQGRSAADYHPHSHAMQPGLARPFLPTHPSTLQHFWSAHHPHAQPPQSPHFQPHAAHSLSDGSSRVCEPEDSSAAKRPCYTGSVYVAPYTTQGISDSTSSSLSPAMAKYAHYLRVCYTRSSLPENPPSPSKCYINLAYISRRTVSKQESEEFKVAMVRGEIDEIARDQGLDFCHVAKRLPNGSYPQVVLVEGAPGVGKTTFAWEFCKKWGKGESKQEYSLVVLLRLRDKRIQEAKCLRDLFYHPDEALPDVIATELINSLGEGVLVLLEGLDELPESQRTELSVFLDLIHGRLLPQVTVLITTRPWASEYLHRNCKEKISQHVEILGFTKQQIHNYLQSVCKPDYDPSLLSDIEKYLSCYPQIHAAMYIPLNAAIVVEVYRQSRTGECIIPKTMTQLYTALSQTLLIRYLQEHPVHGKTKWNIHNFNDLPSDVYEHFLQLSEVAYCGITNDQKLVFSSEDLPQSLETLGFMQSVPELYVNESFSHNFLHLTIQEYLAAVYITQLSPEVMLEHFQNCVDKWSGNSGVFEVVMKFVSGLTKFSGIPSNSIRRLFGKPKYCNVDDPITQYLVKCDYTLTFDHVNWLYETQSSDTINAIFGNVNTIEFEVFGLMPFHYYCLGYCIAHSHCQWKVAFDDEITKENIQLLKEGGSELHISNHDTSIVGITLRFQPDTMPPDELLASLFHTLSLHFRVNLQELIEDYYYLCGSYLRVVIGNWRLLQSLKVLSLMRITVDDFRELCELLASTSNRLKIINTGLNSDSSGPSYVTIEGTYQHTSVSVDVHIDSVDEVTATLSVLSHSDLGLHITAIRIYNQIWNHFDDRACQLARALLDSTMLKSLHLIDHPVGTTGAKAIAKLIHNSKSLEEVNISGCNIDSEGACHLVQALCENTAVKKLDLSDNPFGKRGVMALAKLIRTNKSLEDVKVIDSRIYIRDMFGSGEACENTAVKKLDHTQLIHSNKSMHKVDISSCFIDNEGACHLAQALCENTTLQKMDLSGIPIGQERSVEEGIQKLLEAMTVNSTLRELRLSKGCEEYTKSFPRYSEVRCRVMIPKDWF